MAYICVKSGVSLTIMFLSLSSVLCHHVAQKVVSDVSEEHTAFFFCLYGGGMFLRNVGNPESGY